MPTSDGFGQGDAAAELVEVVDVEGNVIAVVPRGRVRAENLRHRCTYVVVMAGPPLPPEPDLVTVTADTEIWVHQRADWKDVFPSAWDLAFGGLCDVGESWDAAARRELGEEAGIVGAELVQIGAAVHDDDRTSVVGRIYVTRWPDRPSCADGEVIALRRIPLGDLEQWAVDRTVCTDSVALVIPSIRRLVYSSGGLSVG